MPDWFNRTPGRSTIGEGKVLALLIWCQLYQISDDVPNIVSDDVPDIVSDDWYRYCLRERNPPEIGKRRRGGGIHLVDREENARSADQSGSNVSHVLQLPWYAIPCYNYSPRNLISDTSASNIFLPRRKHTDLTFQRRMELNTFHQNWSFII